METEKQMICSGKTECFLVSDPELGKRIDPDFITWLESEDFTYGFHHGWWGCSWVFINLTRKQYAYGMPGMKLVQPIGNHAITVKEFMTIYDIYRKYQGLAPLQFPDGCNESENPCADECWLKAIGKNGVQ